MRVKCLAQEHNTITRPEGSNPDLSIRITHVECNILLLQNDIQHMKVTTNKHLAPTDAGKQFLTPGP